MEEVKADKGRGGKKWRGKSHRAVENRVKMHKNGYKIICDAPTTLREKGLKTTKALHPDAIGN